MTRVILDSHIISAFVLIGHLARSHPFLSDNPYLLQRGGKMFCSCDAQKFLIVPVLDQKQILACGRVSGLETPANTFVTKKRNFPFLEAAKY